MGDTFAISPLDRKRAEIAKAIEDAERVAAGLRAQLMHLDAVIGLFDPARAVDGAQAIPPRPPRNYFGRGELSRMVMEIMRETGSRSPAEIGRQVMVRRGIDPADKPLAHVIKKSVSRVLREMRRRMPG
ncbi:hypothetical protein STAQ_41710 [Allostella sp. ATCC 35155]|nr:hypothetical protein STAQ_41710 [Stella sp. ATCC 35155]